MLLRATDGYYRGEVRDYAPEAARTLLAAGRAENPFADAPTGAQAKAEAAQPDKAPNKPARRRR